MYTKFKIKNLLGIGSKKMNLPTLLELTTKTLNRLRDSMDSMDEVSFVVGKHPEEGFYARMDMAKKEHPYGGWITVAHVGNNLTLDELKKEGLFVCGTPDKQDKDEQDKIDTMLGLDEFKLTLRYNINDTEKYHTIYEGKGGRYRFITDSQVYVASCLRNFSQPYSEEHCDEHFDEIFTVERLTSDANQHIVFAGNSLQRLFKRNQDYEE